MRAKATLFYKRLIKWLLFFYIKTTTTQLLKKDIIKKNHPEKPVFEKKINKEARYKKRDHPITSAKMDQFFQFLCLR